MRCRRFTAILATVHALRVHAMRLHALRHATARRRFLLNSVDRLNNVVTEFHNAENIAEITKMPI